MSQTEPASIDGRVERSAKTRRRILRVTRELILRGTIDPTAREIADRAGITTRTLFRHFSDMEALHRSFIEDADAQASRVMDEPFPEGVSADWRELLAVVIDRRVRVHESLLALYISPIWSRYRALLSDSVQRGGIARRRARLREILPEAILADAVLFEALDGVLSIEYWVSLRRDQRLGVTRAAGVVKIAVEKLTAGH